MTTKRSIFGTISDPFRALNNSVFARLYAAQTISLIGDAFSWVGLALLAFQMSPDRSAVILATALTLRVTVFILCSPFAGVLADRVNRKTILCTTHFVRMGIIACLPFVNAEWQVYVLVASLNVFNAFFTPTYRAIIPQITEGRYYREAVGLSTATYQLLGILGPAMAGIVAVWLGANDIFFVDAATFLVAGIILLTIPSVDLQRGVTNADTPRVNPWRDVLKGIGLLFGNRVLRFALSIEFVSAIAGAMILVNTVGHIRNGLALDAKYYGWVMTAFGLGAALSAFLAGAIDKSKTRAVSMICGAILLGGATSFANVASFNLLLVLWLCAGLGQSLAEMPSETLIAETITSSEQGKVYGSHFAFSHLWWAIAYPVAGFLGTNFPSTSFLYGGLLTLACTIVAVISFRPANRENLSA